VVTRPDHYLALGVRSDATHDEVRDAWRFAIQAYHPDRFTDDGLREQADQMTRRVNAAWQVLGDAELRSRYDRQRVIVGDPVPAPQRELPCPACATLATVPDQGGAEVDVRCPACAQEFSAIVGTHLMGRPELEMRFLAGRYRLHLVDSDGRHRDVRVRRLPAELALSDGDTVSLVFRPDRRRVRYAVVHGSRTDLGWKIG
jgi:curved DNA-binding protein CbpA